MKRKAIDPAGDGSPLKKERLIDPGSTDTPQEALFTSGVGCGGSVSDEDDRESHYTETVTSTRQANTPLTPLSPARKFPSDLKTIRCTHPGCDKTFNRPARLAAHLRSHNNDRPFKCSVAHCDKSYIEEKHLKQHMKGSHSAEREHTCLEPGCGKSFLTATRLRRHQAVHEGQERFRCRDHPPCNQSFRKHQTLQRHIRSEHLHVSPYPCTRQDSATGAVCQSSFDNAGALKRHQEREHGELRFWCDECGKQTDDSGTPKRTGFPTLSLLETHVKQSHISCMFCGLVCDGRSHLDQHVESEHSRQSLEQRKTVVCEYPGCSKTFTKKSNLKAHVQSVHEGSRFVCGAVNLSATEDLSGWPQAEGCGESFVSKARLESHVRFVHLKYQRPDPPKSTAQPDEECSSDLLAGLVGPVQNTRHTVPCTHQGCLFKFRSATELEGHLRSQHADDQDVLGHESVNPPPADGYALPTVMQDPLPLFDGTIPASGNMMNWEDELQDGQFWIGADDNMGPDGLDGLSNTIFDDEWLRDEAEMRQLIGDGDNDLNGLIDPALDQNHPAI